MADGTNRFAALQQKMEIAAISEPIITDTVESTVCRVIEESNSKGKTKGNSSTSAKTRQTTKGGTAATSGGSTNMADYTLGELITSIMTAIQPVITAAVTSAVGEYTHQMLQTIEHKQKAIVDAIMQLDKDVTAAVVDTKALTEKSVWNYDRLEQYSRKENVKIYGLTESVGEDTSQLVTDLAGELGVSITKNDINTCHRLPAPRRRNAENKNASDVNNIPRPIIVRFVRRDTKAELMRNKKKLKGVKRNNWNIYINDDLTQLRSSIARMLRQQDGVKHVGSVNGKLLCTVAVDDNREVTKSVDGPDDLVQKFGWNREKFQQLGITVE